uniref:Uncharacterized protein n=1 Tax=Setaria italica TaxID=4555 RepID=K4ANT4_SETIT
MVTDCNSFHAHMCLRLQPLSMAGERSPNSTFPSSLAPVGILHCSGLAVGSGLATKHDCPAPVGLGQGLGHRVPNQLCPV